MKREGDALSYEEHMREVDERKYSVKTVKIAVFGMTDGLLVMFSFVAGMSGALSGKGGAILLLSGLITLIVESIIMGVVQFVSDKTEKEVIDAWAEQESKAIDEIPKIEKQELVEIYRAEGFSDSTIGAMMDKITSEKGLWVKKMLLEELGLHLDKLRPTRKDPIIMAFTTMIGGLVPLIPLLFGVVNTFYVMIAATSVALFALGALKSYFSKVKWYRSALETMAIGIGVAMVCYAVGVGLQQLLQI